jgi:hypothetical protein
MSEAPYVYVQRVERDGVVTPTLSRGERYTPSLAR